MILLVVCVVIVTVMLRSLIDVSIKFANLSTFDIISHKQ